MRRVVNLALLAGVLAALGTVTDVTGAPVGPPGSAVPEAAVPDAGARQQIGVVERVDAVLGYLDPEPSVTLRYPGAEYVKVHLRRLLLLPGDYLTVADPDRAEVHRYQPESLLGAAAGEWATSVTGDTAVVTLHRTVPDPLGVRAELTRLGVTIDQVARGLRPGEEPPGAPTGREESVCGRDDGRDAICYRSRHPTIYRQSKAVARLLINGVELCTAFRVGPRNRLLTNAHCVENARQAARTEVWFNYQCARCGGWEVFRPTKVRLDRILATDQTLDYTLFTVERFSAVERYGFLELDPRPPRAGAKVYIPQHPRGLPTRVALGSDRDRGGQCMIDEPVAHGYDWNTDATYYCDTQGGSSGSPVLSRDDHRVIALHHFGGCPNSGVRMDRIHPRIARLL